MIMTELTFRLAVADERDALEALQWRASLANEGDREAMLANPDAITLPASQIEAGLVIVAEAGGTVAGFAALLPRDDGEAELDGLFVEPGLWRGGVGRALVERCCQMARAMGASHLHVLGNPHALGFYGRCGFAPLGVQATRFGSGVTLRRPL
jgi:GNAT superfamily N-acetyltransferase